ncbi:S-phase kinase-associated protein 1A [Thraustotheca clavata]|uniref:S-phase kinase-associated protein 1A n=1 Tax=Thraustotheca clavata TaxID=74557 RepID=A0A1V9Y8P0_9STRA|nr:S-phase kinase-associated protein 1A [Thraustotheca clavata]
MSQVIVKVKSGDNELFEVPREALTCSSVAMSVLGDDYDGDEVPLPNVNGKILSKVIEFCNRNLSEPMGEIEKPLKSQDLSDLVPEWCAQFVNIPDNELMDLISAANYLDIKSLLELTCAKAATNIRGKTKEEIRAMFNIPQEDVEDEATPARECDILELTANMAEKVQVVKLVSKEGDAFEVSREAACISGLVKSIIGDDDEYDDEVPLINVDTKVLIHIIDFCKHYHTEPMAELERPLKSQDLYDLVSEWYAKFVDMDKDELFDLILAANYMDIKVLLDLACAKVATLVRGKTSDEIREMFHIPPEAVEQGNENAKRLKVNEVMNDGQGLSSHHKAIFKLAGTMSSINIRLQSNEGQIFEISREAISCSALITTQLEDDYNGEPILLGNVSTNMLAKIVEFCKHNVNEKMPEVDVPLKSQNLADFLPEFYVNFVNIPKGEVLELVAAANYMDMKNLLALACAKTAVLIRGKDPQQIREYFDGPSEPEPASEVEAKGGKLQCFHFQCKIGKVIFRCAMSSINIRLQSNEGQIFEISREAMLL